MGRHLRRDADALRLGAPDELDRPRRREVAQVEAARRSPARCARSRATAISSASAGRPASPSEAETRALVHVPALDERGVLGVVGDHHLDRERLRVRRARCAAAAAVGTAVAVVGEHPHAGLDHLPHLGERLPRQPFRDRADREDVGQARRGRRGRGPRGRSPAWSATGIGVRHRRDGGVATDRGGPGSGLDRLLVLVARLSQVRVQVDEPRRERRGPGAVDHAPRRVGRLRPPRSGRPRPRRRATSSCPLDRIDDPRASEHAVGLAHADLLSAGRRATGRAAPSGPRSRSSPAPRSPTPAGRRRPSRSRPRGSSAPGA